MEQPPILPDHHADAALDGWEPFESRRQKVTPSRWDFLTALLCVLGAVAAVGLMPA